MAPPLSYEIFREGSEIIAIINAELYPRIPAIEDDAVLMQRAIDVIIEAGLVTKIIFQQKRKYEYEEDQVEWLNQVARLYKSFVAEKSKYSTQSLAINAASQPYVAAWYNEISTIIQNLLRSDPISAFVELERLIRRNHIFSQAQLNPEVQRGAAHYTRILQDIQKRMSGLDLIKNASQDLPGHKVSDREIYHKLFRPTVRPDFMFTKVMASYPVDGIELDFYTLSDGTEITIFQLPGSVQVLYHVMPPEFRLSEEKYEIVDEARNILAEHKPKRDEFIDPQRIRNVFSNVGRDLLVELSISHKLQLSQEEIEELTQILVRYTVGFGLIEILLLDEGLQDISINSPMGQTPMFIVHAKYGECYTNIIPTIPEAESWVSKLRLISGRPLDEANPILDTELELPHARSRVAVISAPLDPSGLAFSFRRHRDKPWTLPLFIQSKMITPLAAGLMSFLIDGSRTILVAGTRSAGKSSLLGSFLVEIMRKYRIITIEDTLELPVTPLIKLGYNLQSMKVASALGQSSSEVPATEGIRSTLRLGDSALFVGEVRSGEAKALYEAMRVGALANVVAGTIHGDSPYGVFDRVVNDLQVPATSFKATDIIIVANPIRTADGLHRVRRVTQITEVRKVWTSDPLEEGGFVDLMRYNAKTDELEPTKDLINGDAEIIKSIAGSVKEWAGNWDAVWDNITLRAQLKEDLVNMAVSMNNLDLLEAEFVIKANDKFHEISEVIQKESGFLDSKKILFRWREWLRRSVKLERWQDE